MPELLTARDVELKMFKKVSFGGYSVPDVEEFLNQVAEDMENYALRIGEQQRRIQELEEALKRHEAMKDNIKDALILAQQSAREKEEDAKRRAAQILAAADAKVGEINAQTRRRLEEAEESADEIVTEARTAAAQIIKSAEDIKEEARRRLDGSGAEIARILENHRRELDAYDAEKRRFLRDAGDLVSAFSRVLKDASQNMDAGGGRWPDRALPVSVNEPSLDDEAAVS